MLMGYFRCPKPKADFAWAVRRADVGGVLDVFDRDRLEQLRDRLVAALERLAARPITASSSVRVERG